MLYAGIHDMLLSQAARNGNATALAAPGRASLTYSRLLQQAEETARALVGLGIRPGDRVAIVLPNGPEMAASFLAIASITACAPLNPAYRAHEFEIYLTDLKPRILIVAADGGTPARAVAEKLGISVAELSPKRGGEAGIFSLAPARSPPKKIAAEDYSKEDDVALVLHTSGTSSRPKMVALTQANLCQSARNIAASLELGAADCCLNVMPLYHIHGLIGAVLSSIGAGASIVCAPDANPRAFFDRVDEFHPTWYTAVPSIHAAILECAPRYSGVIARAPLRFIRSCSAALPPRLMGDLEKTFRVPVLEAYGMTEACHQVTLNPLPPAARKPGSVGIPTGTKVGIADENGNLLAAGETGEIVIRGGNVMPGYVENDSANQNAFTGSWFRTGDVGYLDADDYLFINGRTKEIINRGGEKISPREIEEVLLDHPAIADAVVFAVPDNWLGEDVGAAVVLRADRTFAESDLRAFARERLAAFKVPRRILSLPELPKGPTGKLQRIGLAAKLGLADLSAQAAENRTAVAPVRRIDESAVGGRIGQIVERAWTDVLDARSFAADMPWDDAGGDSLKALELWFQIERGLGRKLPLDAFYQNVTPGRLIAAIAALCDAPRNRIPAPSKPGLPLVFLMPGITGDEPLLAHFRAQFGGRVRFELIDYPDWFELLERGVRLDAIVAAVTEEIGARSNGEACFLAGYSFGGFVAYEAARRLVAAGRRVSGVAMIDSRYREAVVEPDIQSRTKALFADPQRLFLGLVRQFVTLCIRLHWFWLLRAFGKWAMSVSPRAAFSFRYNMNWTLRAFALRHWRPAALRVPTVLFRSEENSAGSAPDLGLAELCAPLRVVHIGGTHRSIFQTPQLEALRAQFLSVCGTVERISTKTMA
jgi:oxalate---CoA ligase